MASISGVAAPRVALSRLVVVKSTLRWRIAHAITLCTTLDTRWQSASTDDCPMLRLLALDSGSMFQLLRFLPLLSMASLYASCRQWSEWLRVGGKIVRRYRPVKPSRFHQLLGSWVQLHIKRWDRACKY